MKEWASKLLQVIVAGAVAFALIVFADRKLCQKPPQVIIKTEIDTLIVHDTLRVVEPKYVTVRVVDSVFVPVPVPVKDSADVKDDSVLYVPMVIQQKVYADSTYRAVVSGPAISTYGPSLDSISVFRQTMTITKVETVTVPSPRWGIGIHAGYGAGKGGLTPYIGLGIQYNLWSPKTKK